MEQVEISVKYAGYVERQERQVAEFHKLEDIAIPENIDYMKIHGLRTEARERSQRGPAHQFGAGGPDFRRFSCGYQRAGRCAQGREEICLIDMIAMM